MPIWNPSKLISTRSPERFGARAGDSEIALRASRAVGMARRKVEELIEAAAALAGLRAVDRVPRSARRSCRRP